VSDLFKLIICWLNLIRAQFTLAVTLRLLDPFLKQVFGLGGSGRRGRRNSVIFYLLKNRKSVLRLD
jgi:hypothetical protein